MENIPYIDVVAPYFALANLTTLAPSPPSTYVTIACTFEREQAVHAECTFFSNAELGRHLAILGSLAAAAANPIKQRHYYLALRCRMQNAGITTATPCLCGEARVDSANFARSRVTVDIAAHTPGGELYAKLRVTYAVLTEDVMDMVLEASAQSSEDFGTPWRAGTASPYIEPVVLENIVVRSSSQACATVRLNRVAAMAGHFSGRPAAPIAILAANAGALVEKLVGAGFFAEEAVVACVRLATLGEVLDFEVKTNGPTEEDCDWAQGGMTHRVCITGREAGLVGHIDMKIRAKEDVKARL